MLAARTSSAFVCLRCQLRLARPAPASLRSLPASHARLSSSSSLREAAEEDAPIEKPKERTRRTPSPLWNIRRRTINSVAVSEESAPLGVKALGADAEIIVLRERIGLPQTENEEAIDVDNRKRLKETAESQKSQPVASLAEDNVPLAQVDINKQIETLRPESLSGLDEPNYLTQSEFITLSRRLYSGFTSHQLSRYLSATTGVRSQRMRQEVLQGLIKESQKSRKPSNQTEWRPGVTPLASRQPSVARMQRQKASLSKVQLADQIIRSAWNVVLLEEIETTGELEISLKRWQLSILNSGDAPTLLDRIQQHRSVKIEIYWPKLVLRITADKSSAEYAAEDIKRSLSGICAEKFEFAPWIPYLSPRKAPLERIAQVLSQEDFHTVEKLSGTALQSSKADTVEIRGPTKGQIEDAKRYLLAMMPLKPKFSRSIRTTVQKDEIPKTYIRPSLFTETLPYTFRKSKLGRWSLPIANETPSPVSPVTSLTDDEALPTDVPLKYGGAVTTKLQTGIKNRVVKELLRFDAVPAAETAAPETVAPETQTIETEIVQGQSLWSPKADIQVAAEFGQALFPLNFSNPTFAKDSPSVFTGVIPGLPKFLFDVKWAQSDSTTTTHTLAYQFIPSPKNHNPKTLQAYPNLTVLVTLSPTGEVSVQGVGLGVEEHFIDVLIPDWATDIRYKRTKKVWLHNPEQDENLGGFFDEIRANVMSGERLTAPPTLQLRIPWWTVKGSKKQEEDGVCEAEYVFSGIEHRQTAVVEFEGRSLRYCGQQGGKLAGKDGMLKLYYGPISDNHDVEWTALSRFFEASFRIARRINDAAANTSRLEKVHRKRKEAERALTYLHHFGSTGTASHEEAADDVHHLRDGGEPGPQALEPSEVDVQEKRAEDESNLDHPSAVDLSRKDVEEDEHVKKQGPWT